MESKYIKWEEIWDDEIGTINIEEDNEYAEMVKDFIEELYSDSELELMEEGCELLDNGNLVFFFSESGGQNESDTQGWSRDFTLEFEEDYTFVSIEYSQG